MSAYGFAAVGIGAALGAWLRWILGIGLNVLVPNLPLGTLAANLIGGYLIGVAVALFEQHAFVAPELRLFVITGFLGGLTTYSTFSAESVALLTSGRYGWAAAHTLAHLVGSIVMTVLGMLSVRALAA
jgi:CrcB protein